MLIEMVFCAVWTFFYFAAAVDAATKAPYRAALGAASFFGFAAMVAYGADAFLKLQGWRAGQLAQGERTVQRSTAQVEAPAY